MKYIIYVQSAGSGNIEYSEEYKNIDEVTSTIKNLNDFLKLVYSDGYRIVINAEWED